MYRDSWDLLVSLGHTEQAGTRRVYGNVGSIVDCSGAQSSVGRQLAVIRLSVDRAFVDV